MSESEIAATVEECLSEALADARPFYRACIFLELLRSRPDSTPEAIAEIQTRVIRGLMGTKREGD